jgi:hypothetical protein
MQTGKPRSQFSTFAWFVVTAIIALPIGGCLVLLVGSRLVIHAVVVGETGIVETRDKWPDPLKKLVNDRQDIAIDTIKVYQLCQGFDPEYVLRFDAPIDLRDYVVEKWELTQVLHHDYHRYLMDGVKSRVLQRLCGGNPHRSQI